MIASFVGFFVVPFYTLIPLTLFKGGYQLKSIIASII